MRTNDYGEVVITWNEITNRGEALPGDLTKYMIEVEGGGDTTYRALE